MNSSLGEGISYANIMCYVLEEVKKSVAIKKVKETSQILLSLGYSHEEVDELLHSVLDKKNY